MNEVDSCLESTRAGVAHDELDSPGAERAWVGLGFLFRAVEVPASRSEVRFAYDAARFRSGPVVSGVTALGLLLAAAWTVRSSRRSERAV